MISMVSKLFDLILLGLFGYLGFLCFGGLSWVSVSISPNLFSVSICKIPSSREIFLWGLAVGFNHYQFFFVCMYVWGLLGLAGIERMYRVCCCWSCIFVWFVFCGWVFSFISL